MKSKFKIRDRVTLSEAGEARWKGIESNPVNCPGTVTEVSNLWIKVDWDDGTSNTYNADNQLDRL